MPDLTKIFASFRARQLTMTGIGRHLEPPEADILKKDFPDAVVALGPRAGWDTFVMNMTASPRSMIHGSGKRWRWPPTGRR